MTTFKRPPLFNCRRMTQPGFRRNRRFQREAGQGLVEFAIVLPILLLLIFGLIEFARIFQAWMAVTNSARFGMRYAVTGEYDVTHCSDLNGNGLTCEAETDRVTRSQEQDVARLFSIKDVSRGVAIGPLIDDGALEGEPGYFKVTVCSSRPGFMYLPPPDDTCTPQEDPGNPEGGAMRVMVSVTYEHPLILPFLKNIVPSVTLHAERSGILENFRVARVMGLPPVIAIPTMTPGPTDTPVATPTNTPSPSPTPPPPPTDTPTPTETPTQTPTFTPTPTRAPSCDDLEVGNLRFSNYNSGRDMAMFVQNLNVYPIQITNIKADWKGQNGWHDQVEYQPHPTDQSFDRFVSHVLGGAVMYDPPDVKLIPGFQVSGNNLNAANSTIPPGASGDLGLRFKPRSFTSYYVYYHASDFSLTFSYKVGSLSCGPRTVTGLFGPTVEIANTVPNNFTAPFTIQANATDPDPGGSINRVRFEIYDSTGKLVGEQNETRAPYCLFGKSGGKCATRGVGNTWPGSTNKITNGTYTVYIQARDNDSPRQYTRIKTPIQINFLPTPTPCPANGRGLLGVYQDYKNPNNGSAPNVNLNKPGLVRLENVNFNWRKGSPGPGVSSDYFVARWSGRVMPLYSEEYTFIASTDDGVRLWVNGVKLIDEWKDKGSSPLSGQITLEGCRWYDITMEYYERRSDAVARLSWSSSQQEEEIIPVRYLDPPTSGVPATSTPPPNPTATPTNTAGPTATHTPLPLRPTETPTPTATKPVGPPTEPPATSTQPPPKPTTPASKPTTNVPPTATQPPPPPPTSTPCPGGGFDC